MGKQEVIDLGIDVECKKCGNSFSVTTDNIHKVDNRGKLWLLCPSCGKPIPATIDVKKRVLEKLNEHGLTVGEEGVITLKEYEELQAQKQAEASMIEYQGDKYTPEDLIMTFGLEGLYHLMKVELERALRESPANFSDRMIKWILDQFDRYDHYKQNPTFLASAIRAYNPKVSQQVVYDIVAKVFSIPEKYRGVVEFAMRERPELFVPKNYFPQQPESVVHMFTPAQQESFQPPYPNPLMLQAPPQTKPIPQNVYLYLPYPLNLYYNPQTSNYVTREELERMLKEREEKSNRAVTFEDLQKTLEERDRKLFERFEKILKEKEEKDKFEELLEKIRELEEEVKKNEEEDEDDREDRVIQVLSRLEGAIRGLKELKPSEPKKENPIEIVNQTKELIEAVRRLGVDDDVRRKLDDLEGRLSKWTGEIDDKKLRLEELEKEKELKRIEAESIKDSVDRIANAIERFGEFLGAGVARGLISPEKGYSNVMINGDTMRVICPSCGTEFSRKLPVEGDLKCPVCGHLIMRGFASSTQPQQPQPERKDLTGEGANA